MHKPPTQVYPLHTHTDTHTTYVGSDTLEQALRLSASRSFIPTFPSEGSPGFMMEENVRKTTEWRLSSWVPTWLGPALRTASWSHITCLHASLTGSDCKETPSHSHVQRFTTQRDSTLRTTNWSHITETLTKRKVSPSYSHTHTMRTYS